MYIPLRRVVSLSAVIVCPIEIESGRYYMDGCNDHIFDLSLQRNFSRSGPDSSSASTRSTPSTRSSMTGGSPPPSSPARPLRPWSILSPWRTARSTRLGRLRGRLDSERRHPPRICGRFSYKSDSVSSRFAGWVTESGWINVLVFDEAATWGRPEPSSTGGPRSRVAARAHGRRQDSAQPTVGVRPHAGAVEDDSAATGSGASRRQCSPNSMTCQRPPGPSGTRRADAGQEAQDRIAR
jgi:hypothetical protein